MTWARLLVGPLPLTTARTSAAMNREGRRLELAAGKWARA